MLKKITLFLLLLAVFAVESQAQSIVNLNLKQNPLFSVSTNEVVAVMEGKEIVLGADIVISGGSGNYTYRWYTSDGELGTDKYLTIQKTGEYLLDIKDECDCMQTVAFHITGTDGVDNVPVDAIVQTVVFTVNGRLVKVSKGSVVDTSSLPNGVYVINRVGKNGKIDVRKFVKE